MRCPTLADLPPPPPGRAGWPWTVETPPAPPAMPDGSPWPRVSIVTPSYNQGRYLEETIRSVLLQGYPDLDYIVIDGGSSDESLAVIRKYARWLAHWVSEKDRGQADAINKGLARSTGEIFQFINSDDYLAAGAVRIVASAMAGHDAVAGPVVEFEDEGAKRVRFASTGLTALNFVTRPAEFLYHQPGVWMRRALAAALGGFDTDLHFKFDWEFMLRYVDRYPRVAYLDDNLGFSRLHKAAKTVAKSEGFSREDAIARERAARRIASAAAKAALTAGIRKRQWRLRLDDAGATSGFARLAAIGSLLWAAASHPLSRVDRYFLGTLRRLLARRA